jgi:hypothetical protein
MRHTYMIALMFLASLLTGCSGDKSPNPPAQGNQPPAAPGNPEPAHLATDQDTSITLHWSCSDPDGDSVFYEVHLGNSPDPPKVATGLTTNRYQTSGLKFNNTYYWRVSARDTTHNSVASPVWRFSTKQKSPTFVDPYPTDHAQYAATSERFTWKLLFGPPAGVVYDVHFGQQGVFTDQRNGLTDPYAIVGRFEYGATYQWYVVARQQQETIATGPVWEFTVREQLTRRGQHVTTPRLPNCAAFSGNYLYACMLLMPDWNSGNLIVLDVSNPDMPTVLGGVGFPDGRPEDIAVSGSTAYVVHISDGLSTVDVSNPASPRYLATYEYREGFPFEAVTVHRHYAYVAASTLLTFDVSNPSSPRLVNSLENVGGDIVCFGSYAYSYQAGALAVLDIADPEHPRVISTTSTDLNSEDRLFVKYPILFSGRTIYSIENPSTPVFMSEFSANPYGIEPAVSVCWSEGNLAIAAIRYRDTGPVQGYAAVIDISDPRIPLIVKEYSFNCITDVVSDGNVIVVTGYAQPCQVSTPTGEILVLSR